MRAIVLVLLFATAAAAEQPNCFVTARPHADGVQIIVSALPGYRVATHRAHALQSGFGAPVRPTTVTGFEVAWVVPAEQAKSFTVTAYLTNRLRTRQWPVHLASAWDGTREICAANVVDSGPTLPEEPGVVAQAESEPPKASLNPIAPPPRASLPETTLAAPVIGGAPIVGEAAPTAPLAPNRGKDGTSLPAPRTARTKIQRSESTSKLLESIRKRH